MLIRELAVLFAIGRIAFTAGGRLATSGAETRTSQMAPMPRPVAPFPHRSDPFLPLDLIKPGQSVLIPEQVLDFGLPPALPGPDAVPAADWPRVTAIAWDYQGKVFAVLELDGQNFIVEPGDFITSALRVAAMDAQHGTLTLRSERGTVVVPLMPRAVPAELRPQGGNSGDP